MWKNWIRMSRHVIVSDSWWFISKSLASNNFRQISIGLLVKTLGVWAWELSQESQVWAAFFVTRLELGRILPLFLPFLNIVCAKERTKQNVCLVSCTTYMCTCVNSVCVHVRMCGAIRPQASTQRAAEGKPQKAETLVQKKNMQSASAPRSPRTPTKAWSHILTAAPQRTLLSSRTRTFMYHLNTYPCFEETQKHTLPLFLQARGFKGELKVPIKRVNKPTYIWKKKHNNPKNRVWKPLFCLCFYPTQFL